MSSLGVGISDPKSWISTETCEFAKRYLYRGEEITPFPISAVMDNLGEIPLLVSALSGEEKKGLVPRNGIPGSVGALARSLHHRRANVRNWENWSRHSLMATEFMRGNVEALEFFQSLNHPFDESIAEVYWLYGQQILRAALTALIRESLSKKKVNIGEVLLDDIDKLLMGGTGGVDLADEDLSKFLPVVGVLLRMEKSLLRCESKNFLDSDSGEVLSDVLEEFLANPLQMSSWGLDTRSRRARGYSRLARRIRLLSEEWAKNQGIGNTEELRPRFPIQREISMAAHMAVAEVPFIWGHDPAPEGQKGNRYLVVAPPPDPSDPRSSLPWEIKKFSFLEQRGAGLFSR